jgi:hypothetical protein
VNLVRVMRAARSSQPYEWNGVTVEPDVRAAAAQRSGSRVCSNSIC